MAPRRRSGSRSKKLSIMNNKWFLYFLSIVAVGQLVTYGIDQKWESTILFVIIGLLAHNYTKNMICLLYTSPSPRDRQKSRMPSSA